MRFVNTIAVSLLFTAPVFASGFDEHLPDMQSLLALETRAEQAAARDQCFLYAEVVHGLTELAGHQLSSGDSEHASATLRLVVELSQKIHMDMSRDSKRLKNSELLMEHTAFRLKEFLGSASLEDRPALESTLKRLNQLQSELMLQVFQH